MRNEKFRAARRSESEKLMELERAASQIALSHVFPAEAYPYPSDDVHARWVAVLAEPGVTTLVCEDDRAFVGLICFDREMIRHLAVRPDRWRGGVASALLHAAANHADPRRLWCLEQNSIALDFYAARGWKPTGRRQTAEWPPYPAEVELALRPAAHF